MKIALAIERFDPARGGKETSTAQLAAALAARGQDVTVLCQSGKPPDDGVAVQPLGAGRGGKISRSNRFVKAVRRAAGEGGFDVLHATLPIPGADVYQPRGGLEAARGAASLRRRRGLRRLASLLGEPLNHRRRHMRQLERKVVADPATLCLALSEMVAREFLHHYARSEGVRVLFNGVDVPNVSPEQRSQWRREARDRIGVGPNGPVFLTVAQNFELKGVREAIEAFSRWGHSAAGPRRARLVVVGQSKVRRYRLLARRLGVGRHVYFAGPTDEVFSWYAAADACLLLSWYDACSRVVLEATRWGIPSITTVYNGAAEVLARGAGIVVGSPRDTDAIVRALAELADPDRRAERAAACRDIADELSMDRHVEKLLAVYREVVARK